MDFSKTASLPHPLHSIVADGDDIAVATAAGMGGNGADAAWRGRCGLDARVLPFLRPLIMVEILDRMAPAEGIVGAKTYIGVAAKGAFYADAVDAVGRLAVGCKLIKHT